jgi:hypothetical protein
MEIYVKSFLTRVGIYGYKPSHERAMLASLLTGTPLLMVGRIGEAKTRVAEAMAELLLGTPKPGEPKTFQKIAADKAQFEDMVGFPNPKTLAEGKIEYATTPISIMDKKFVLIDEISRCNPQLQNKFLEVVLERQVMGMQTDIQWVWATMNPLDYPGSNPLDEALAGRMGYVIQVQPTVDNADDRVIEKIVASRNYAQTPALAHWTSEQRSYKFEAPQELRDELHTLLMRAGRILEGLEDNWTSVIATYITRFAKGLKNTAGLTLDGRRLVMIRYNIIANIAIATVQEGRALPISEIKELCRDVITLSLPWVATGALEKFDASKLLAAHKIAADALDAGDGILYALITEQDDLRKAQLYLDHKDHIDPLAAINLVASLYDPITPCETRAETWSASARRFWVQLALTQLFLDDPSTSPEILSLVSKNYPILFNHGTGENATVTMPHSGRDYTYIYDPRYQPVSLKISSPKDLDDARTIYRQALESDHPHDWARMYWALFGYQGTLSLDEINERLLTARLAHDEVVFALTPYKKAIHATSTAQPLAAPGNDEEPDEEATAPNGRAGDPAGTLERTLTVV